MQKLLLVKLIRDLAGVLYRADKASRACFACQASSQCNWKAVKKNQEIQW